MSALSNLFKKKPTRTLLIDINSATVSVAHIELGSGMPLVTGVTTAAISIAAQPSMAELEKNMLAAVAEALAAMQNKHLGSPDSVQVCLASPWYASQVRLAKLTRTTQFTVTKSILDDMVARELKAFTEVEVKNNSNPSDPLRAIESRTIAVRLNGYDTREPIGHVVSELELSLFLAVASDKLLNGIEDVIEHVFPKRRVTFVSFLSTTYLVARTLLPHEDEYLLIDAGGEVTDVSLVREGALFQTISFPQGRNAVVRRLADALNRSKEEAASMWKLSEEGKLDGTVAQAAAFALKEARREWLEAFSKALFTISNDLSIPHTILITVDSDTSSWFISTVKDESFHQYTRTATEFKVLAMDPSLFHGTVFFAPDVPRDPAVTIEVIGLGYLRNASSAVQ